MHILSLIQPISIQVACGLCFVLLVATIFVLRRQRSTEAAERRQTEAALCESENKFRSISAFALDAIIMMNDEGNICFWNDVAKGMFGYAHQEVIGRNLHNLLAPSQYHEQHSRAFTQFRTTGQGAALGKLLELTAVHKNGTEFPIELSVSALQLSGRRHAVGVVRDISARKHAELQLLQAKKEVESVNEQLEQAIEQANRLAMTAECANVAKSAFLASMSHEIRTPMNGVIGMTGLLLDTDMTLEQHEYAETIKNSANALLALINDILDFSKIESGKIDLETLDFDLRATTEEIGDILALPAHQKGLEMVCLIDTDVPLQLRGDPGRLRQVLINLVNNAIKFTHQGEVAIHICRESANENQTTLRFDVKDSGIGIPKDKRGVLFQPFSQVDASTTRNFGGTGLGLSICKGIVGMMGGQIGLESEMGKGSTFWFTVPFHRQPVQVPPPVDADTGLTGVRVLAVDDNQTNRTVLANLLKSWNCRHEVVSDADTALARLHEAAAANDPFRIALLDMIMPGTNGETLGQMIKQNPALQDTKLVMMASAIQRGEAARLNKLGFAASLIKPVKHAQLQNCLLTILNHLPQLGFYRAQVIEPQTLEENRHTKSRILLAEDNITNQQVAMKILEKLGYQADVVANGLEAIKALETIPYDLVLMDVQMPELDGIEATQQIRSQQSAVLNHCIPIVAMTANAMQDDRKTCLRAGMNDYISKPVQPKVLAQTIARWLVTQPSVKLGTTREVKRSRETTRSALPSVRPCRLVETVA